VAQPASPFSSAFLISLAVLGALLHAVLAVTATAQKNVASDEIAHVTAGLAYNTRNDYRLQPENGNLPQRLAALPLTLAGRSLPPTDWETWKTAHVWQYGYNFFYTSGLSTDEFLFLGRGVIALVSAATALLVFFWSRTLFGWRGAFLSLTLFIFCPAFLAHGALTTSDVVMTFFFFASVWAWWSHLENPGFGGALLSAITLGLAFVAKFSAVLLPPMLGLAALVWACGEARRQGWGPPLTRLARTTGLHVAITWLTIWLFYGFRFSAFAPALADGASFNHGWGFVLTDLGLSAKIIWTLQEWRVLPEAFLYGFAFVLQFAQARGAFLNGDYSTNGWVSFFPIAFLIKTTLPLLILLALGIVCAGRKALAAGTHATLARLRPLTPLAALFAIYWATSLTSHLNIGHRHILPTYPVLFIAAGWLGRFIALRRLIVATLITGLALWHIGVSGSARPNYLAYFNELVGGSKNGSRHLVDSSLDWGQDLPGVKHWLDAHARPNEPVFMSYFGTGDPTYEGMPLVRRLPFINVFRIEQPLVRLEPGLYCIGATMLSHVYSDVRGPWTIALENEYQAARVIEPDLVGYTTTAGKKADMERTASAARWTAIIKRYDVLRFARLCYYLRLRAPEAQVGYSIFIYRLSAAEIHAATAGTLGDWTALIERTVARPPE